MGTHNALYFHGELPAGYRPSVEGPCALRRLGSWTQLSLPGVDDGAASALSLSRSAPGQVIWAIVQTTASAVGITHFEQGRQLRRIEFGDGSWYRVEGEPQTGLVLMSNAANVIALPEDLQAFAEERVRAGDYASVGDVAHEAFRLLQQRDERRHQVREDLVAVFREMDEGTYLEPSDDEFEQAVQARALIHSAE